MKSGMKIILVILTIALMSQGSQIVSKFTRFSLKIQQQLALSVANSLNSTVYVYDSSNTFLGAKEILVNKVRVLKKQIATDIFYGVLRSAAQATIPTANTYRQFSESELPSDVVGDYIRPQ